MKDGVGDAKLEVDKNPCTLDDIELVEKGVQSVWRPDAEGNADYHIEDYSMEAHYAYYSCTNCGMMFDMERDDFGRIGYEKEEEWKKVKEHLDGQL